MVGACMAKSASAIRCTLGPATVPCDVAEASVAQTPPRHPTSHHAMQEGETVETSAAELRGDLLWSSMVAEAMVRLNRRRSRSRLLTWQNLPPSVVVGGRDLLSRSEASSDGCPALDRSGRQAMHQPRARTTTPPTPLCRPLPCIRTAPAPPSSWTGLDEGGGRGGRPCRPKNCLQVCWGCSPSDSSSSSFAQRRCFRHPPKEG
jgi:hypothetical protein